MIEKIENIKRPVKKGEKYLVPCVVREESDITFITPVLNHPHNDKENGQHSAHYHADFRFVKHHELSVVNKHKKYHFVEETRLNANNKIEYFILPVINEDFDGITGVELISRSKLKHNCIYKGKCPHRGYDLSQVSEKDGKITCPLHGLEFDAVTKTILNFETTN